MYSSLLLAILIRNAPSKLIGMKIFGWAADQAGCQYYRIRLPLETLGAEGLIADYSMEMPREYLEDKDWTIIGQRVCNPAPSSLWRKMADQGRKLIYEIDDDLFNVDPDNKTAYGFFGNPEIQKNIKNCARAASRVIVSTEPLAEIMREFNSDVVVCPNTIPAWLLDERVSRRKEEKVTIGWGGSPTHKIDFGTVRNHIRRVLDRHPEAEFHAIGTNYASWMRIPESKCRFTPWVTDVPTFFRKIDYDIGIAPLKHVKFNRSKSHIKALECAALGIPIVASNIEPYRNFLQDGVTGFLVESDHQWGTYLRELIEDEYLRLEMGNQAREMARKWTIEANIEMWRKAYTL